MAAKMLAALDGTASFALSALKKGVGVMLLIAVVTAVVTALVVSLVFTLVS